MRMGKIEDPPCCAPGDHVMVWAPVEWLPAGYMVEECSVCGQLAIVVDRPVVGELVRA